MIIPNTEYAIEPWLLYLNSTGQVTIILHRLSFHDRIQTNFHIAGGLIPTQLAAYMRLDIPLVVDDAKRMANEHGISVRTDYALYTDLDILMYNMTPWVYPAYVSMGPQAVYGTLAENSGVMHINITSTTAELPALLDFADAHKWNFPAGDQGLLMEFYKGRIVALDPEYNWKPYWGIKRHVRVVHFHASKFQICVEGIITARYANPGTLSRIVEPRCLALASNLDVQRLPNMTRTRQIRSYAYYMADFYSFLAKLDVRVELADHWQKH